MPSFLVFQLKAPLASFGSSSGNYRATDLRPRRSAVVGLLAAALGIERAQSERFAALSSALRLATVALKPPTVLVDFHTVQAPASRLGTTRREQLATGEPHCLPTRREYLQDGHWLVALQGPAQVLHECAQALEFPVFPLYIGRKCCVLSAYTAARVIEAETVELAVREWVSGHPEPGVTLAKAAPLYWDEGMAVASSVRLRHARADQRTSLAHNFFSSRIELEGALS